MHRLLAGKVWWRRLLGADMFTGVRASDISTEQLTSELEAAIRAAGQLRRRPPAETLTLLDGVVAMWLAPGSTWMSRARQELPAATGFSAAMIDHALPLMFESLRSDTLLQVIESESGSPRPADARLPRLLLQILAGNIPAIGVPNVLLALALGIPIVEKPALGDALFPILFAESVKAADAGLGAAYRVVHWRGGAVGLEAVAFARAAVVTAFGSDASLANIAARVPGRFLGHGHKVSFAAVGREILADRITREQAAERLAYDVSLWDQQGCLSPQLCYLEQVEDASLEQFVSALARNLERLAQELPPGLRSLEDHAAIQRFRQQAEWADGAGGLPPLVTSRDGTDWSLAITMDPRFEPSCLSRSLRLKVVPDLESIPTLIAPMERWLEAAGVAVAPQREAALAASLRGAGVHRVCALGSMQRPDLSWKPGGRSRIADWLDNPGAS